MSDIIARAMAKQNASQLAEKAQQTDVNYSLSDKYKFLMVSFNTTRMKLCLLGSNDGVNYNVIGNDIYTPALSPGSLRDPDMVQIGDTFFITYTAIGWGTGSYIGMVKTKDFKTFTELAQLTIGTFNKVWAPAFYVENGVVHIIVNASPDGTNFQSYMVDYDSVNHAVSNLTQITGSNFPVTMIDSQLYKINNTYYLLYKNESTKYIEIATSQSMTSGYTVVKSGDWAGFGSGYEGQAWIPLDNGNYRMYFEDYTTNIMYYADSATSDPLGTWGAKTALVYNVSDTFSHPDYYYLKNFTYTKLPTILNPNINKSIPNVQLATGTIATLAVSPNTLYTQNSTNVTTIQNIDYSALNDGDMVYFSLFSGNTAASITIKSNPSNSIYLVNDIVLSVGNNNSDRIVALIKIAGSLRRFNPAEQSSNPTPIVPSLTNGWVVDSNTALAPPVYWKDSDGVVHIRGAITSGTIGQPAFYLGSGYLPLKNENFAVVSNSAFGLVTVTTDGRVIPAVGSNVEFWLSGISFITS